MQEKELILPTREMKPRKKGLTILIDNGAPLNFFQDTINSFSDYIDFVKFGWGTSLVTNGLHQKIDWLRNHDIEFFFGGTLFEKFLSQGKIEHYYDYCKQFECNYVELSNGTVPIDNREKARFISEFSQEFIVFSEVGKKDVTEANAQDSSAWLQYIQQDIQAGATKVILESRESGTSGICREDGNVRMDILDFILDASIPIEKLIFEAPTKKMQTFFIKRLGVNVNLANISLQDIISLETLRLGLRADTFHIFKVEGIK
ncbi:MAG TPA: phosphosulfolactate synthase [Bacillota bacterium]